MNTVAYCSYCDKETDFARRTEEVAGGVEKVQYDCVMCGNPVPPYYSNRNVQLQILRCREAYRTRKPSKIKSCTSKLQCMIKELAQQYETQ